MQIFLGADHRGFKLKNQIKSWLKEQEYQVIDQGNFKLDPEDDFPDFALAVAQEVAKDSNHRGILFCSSGVGMAMAANKVKNIRAAVAASVADVQREREHNNLNILALAADSLNLATAKKIIQKFLTSKFLAKDKYKRRLAKIL